MQGGVWAAASGGPRCFFFFLGGGAGWNWGSLGVRGGWERFGGVRGGEGGLPPPQISSSEIDSLKNQKGEMNKHISANGSLTKSSKVLGYKSPSHQSKIAIRGYAPGQGVW